ncbi:TIR domain-containing adapter molecule 2 [Ambystoma mexicanum]|uniref:TIR domain-containing adapter molecule 2 n=1 Tax=Ambystoma mexicanum TaxID=8296 RepID=UPI0037E7A229
MGVSNSKQNHQSPNSICKDVVGKNDTPTEMNEDVESGTLSHPREALPEVETNSSNEITWFDEEEVFYKFVILHSQSDIEEAIRLQDILQTQFHIEPGIIFAEMPCGRHKLQNLEDAVNGSAWTIILLTENFLSEAWCEYQSYATLMNSINKQHKYNSVIPVRPASNGLSRERTPFVLQAINALEERSPAFAQQVVNTFQETLYKKQQELWKKERWKENKLE